MVGVDVFTWNSCIRSTQSLHHAGHERCRDFSGCGIGTQQRFQDLKLLVCFLATVIRFEDFLAINRDAGPQFPQSLVAVASDKSIDQAGWHGLKFVQFLQAGAHPHPTR